MISASGGRGKADIVREVPNADKGEGVKISENYADVLNGSALTHRFCAASSPRSPASPW